MLTGEVALRGRDLWQPIAAEHEREVVSGRGARDHVPLFLSYRPNQNVSQIVPWLKGISSRVLLQEFAHLRKGFWGRHLWARGDLAVSSGTMTDEMSGSILTSRKASRLPMTVDFPSTTLKRPPTCSRWSFNHVRLIAAVLLRRSVIMPSKKPYQAR